MRKHQQGFSILELGIVLVVVALVFAGALTGQSLVRQAKLRSVTSDLDRYTKAITGFQEKFLALPGDMNNAESFWGTDPRTCPWTISPQDRITNKATCNGDGDGKISAANYFNEPYRAWQQLAAAQMVDGAFTGVARRSAFADFQGTFNLSSGDPGYASEWDYNHDNIVNLGDIGSWTAILGPTWSSAQPVAFPGKNIPASSMEGAGFSLLYFASDGSDPDYFALATAQHALFFGRTYSERITEGAALTTAEARDIDTKIDDGVPYTGNVLSHKSGGIESSCVPAGNTPSAYTTGGGDTPVCSLIFLLGF